MSLPTICTRLPARTEIKRTNGVLTGTTLWRGQGRDEMVFVITRAAGQASEEGAQARAGAPNVLDAMLNALFQAVR